MNEVPRTNKWVDGKNPTMWPLRSNIGWVVQTAGIVELDLIQPKSVMYNTGPQRIIPAKTKAVLKHVDEHGRAYVYGDNGVMMMPVELLEIDGK